MSSKIKLVFFHPYSHIGGADNSLYRLIKNLDLKDFSITFISLNNSFLKKLLNKNIEFKQINSSRTLYAISDLKKIINKFTENKKFKKVILISNQNFANIASYFATKNNPNVKTIFIDRNHLDELNFFRTINEKLKNILLKILIKYTYPKADLIIGISKKLSSDLQRLINKKVKTIYNPSFDKTVISYSRKKINLSKNFKYIINVSRFTKRKDIPTTLRAFKIASNNLNNIKLILIGYGNEKKNIISLAKKLNIYNKIIIIEKSLNPYSYVRKSEILLLTSLYEGFGNVLVESIALGTPVISTNSNAGPSEILMNNKGGDLVKIGDYKNLAKKIINHFKNPKILKNKTKYAKKYLFRFEIKNHAKLYKKIFFNI